MPYGTGKVIADLGAKNRQLTENYETVVKLNEMQNANVKALDKIIGEKNIELVQSEYLIDFHEQSHTYYPYNLKYLPE